jgi:hypothetical protein
MLARFLAVIALGLSTGGCIIVDDDDEHHVAPPPSSSGYYTTIDEGVTLEPTFGFGHGAGLFVEYETGGLWTVFTSCDTLDSGFECQYEINVSTHYPFYSLDGFDLEPGDAVESYSDYDFTMFSWTDVDWDEMQFTTEPGQPVQIELVLDGFVEPAFFRWGGDGAVYEGAPYSPVVFQPNVP